MIFSKARSCFRPMRQKEEKESVAQHTQFLITNLLFQQQMTWADLSVMNVWHWIPGFGVEVNLDGHPKLKAHKQRIEAHPRVQHWIETRPETPI